MKIWFTNIFCTFPVLIHESIGFIWFYLPYWYILSIGIWIILIHVWALVLLWFMYISIVLRCGGIVILCLCRGNWEKLCSRDFVVRECERYTCKHFGYSDQLPPMGVGEFLLSEPRKSLYLLCLISVRGCVSAIDITSVSSTTIDIRAFWLWN